MSSVLLKDSPGDWSYCFSFSKPLPRAVLAACLLSGQQDHCLSGVRLSYLERAWDSSESHLSPALLHRQWSGKIVNTDWMCWDRCGCSAGSEACLHHAGMLKSLLCTLLPFRRWSLLPGKGNLLNLKLIKASIPHTVKISPKAHSVHDGLSPAVCRLKSKQQMHSFHPTLKSTT